MTVLIKISCKACGTALYRNRGRVNENLKFGHNFYCSRNCEYQYKMRRKTVTCENPVCCKTFVRVFNDILSHNYCSQPCAAHVNNQKFPKRGPGFKICAYAPCSRRFKGKTKYCSMICYGHSRKKYTLEELIEKLKQKSILFGRMPAKREVKPLADACVNAFGSWNNAILAAGLKPNRSHSQRMYRRMNTTAKDGHACDSISEAIVDNWLTDHRIKHARDASYPSTHHKADWDIGGTFVEYFGLAKDSPRYDRAIKTKRDLCRKHNIPLVEIYPEDIYPSIILESKLNNLLV